MYCKKKEKRNLFNLFKDNECKNCKYYLEDEVINIGSDKINIYYLENKCRFNNNKIVIADKRIKLIIKDILVDSLRKTNNLFLFLDKSDNFSNYYNIFEKLIENEYKIYIIE